MLLGEYAVLDGGPALVAAVDRGVWCEVSPADTVEIEVPGDARFVGPALAAVGAAPGRYTFGAWNPVDAPVKVGLGSSAAATVAAVLAGCPVDPGPAARFAIARDVHRAVQGSGSGIDVAASTFGGVSRFRSGVVRPEVLRGPAAVSPSVVFTGVSAATGPRVERYLGWTDRAGFVAEMTAAVDRFADDPIGAIRDGGRALRRMADAAGLAYWTDGIDVTVRLAERHGGAGKPSGAGGGDVVVAVLPDDHARAAFVREVAAAGLLHVPVAVAPAAHRTE
ncbi:MAG: hypothetical protein ABMB14_12565 [Myxococcota bacterium]